MNIVVTGATSFLGTALVRRLLAEGHQVYGVIRPASSHRAGLLEAAGSCSGFHLVESELSELSELHRKVPSPCPLYFHLGWDGSGSENRKNPAVQRKNAEDGMKALLGAKRLGCRRFLFSGSQAEYGICQTRMAEDAPCHPVSEYGKAKLEFGRQAREAVRRWRQEEQAEMEFLHTRIFSVYGPGDHPWSLVNTCLSTFLAGGQMNLGACTQQWNFLHIDDLVRGLCALAFCPKPLAESGYAVYNVAGGDDATMPLLRYVEQMYQLCGEKGSFQCGVVKPNAEGQANLIPDIEKIRTRTGWKPEVSFERGIQQMIAAMEMRSEERCEDQSGEKRQERRACILCGSPLPDAPLLELSDMPASAQNIPDASQVGEDRGVDLRLHRCPSCGLVQFDCEPVDYYRDVIRSGGYSTTMVNLRTSQYRHLIDTYHLEGKKFLEVGCGQGEFLKVLTGFPVEAYGVEHRKALVDQAVAAGLSVTQGFTETADTVLGEQGPYDVFLSFNFLEHQPNPGVMLDCIWNNLTEDGMGLLTVPSLEYIQKYDGYYELIRDHIAYYTFDTLRYLLESHGFAVLEEEMVNRDTLSAIVRKIRRDGAAGTNSQENREADAEAKAAAWAQEMKASLADMRRQMEDFTRDLEERQKTLAVWGASHQGFTLAATTCLGQKAEYIIDSAPFKQGRFAPASHLPIVSPEDAEKHPVDVILIVAPGYTEEIASVIRTRFGTSVQILTLRSDRLEDMEV